MDLDMKQMKDMTDEELSAILAGEAMAIPVARPKFSSMLFSISCGLIVACMIAVFMIPLSVVMVEGALVAALGWLVLYKLSTNFIAQIVTENRVLSGLLSLIGKTIDKQQEIDGTKPKNDGLTDVEHKNDTPK